MHHFRSHPHYPPRFPSLELTLWVETRVRGGSGRNTRQAGDGTMAGSDWTRTAVVQRLAQRARSPRRLIVPIISQPPGRDVFERRLGFNVGFRRQRPSEGTSRATQSSLILPFRTHRPSDRSEFTVTLSIRLLTSTDISIGGHGHASLLVDMHSHLLAGQLDQFAPIVVGEAQEPAIVIRDGMRGHASYTNSACSMSRFSAGRISDHSRRSFSLVRS